MKYLLLALAFSLAGCASHQFAEPSGPWKTRTGQLLYKEGSRSLVGELVVSTNGQDARLEFAKGPVLSLMRVKKDATHARFEGPLARLGHTVEVGKASGRDAGWLSIISRSARENRFSLSSGGADFAVQLSTAK